MRIGDLPAAMLRAVRLEADFYEQVEHDPTAISAARIVVLLAALASGIGAAIFSRDFGTEAMASAFVLRFVTVWAGWFLWAWISAWIGTSVTAGSETESDLSELLRVLAFAHTPWILSVFLFVPVAGPVLFVGASIWVLVAGIVAIRQALDFTTLRAVWTVIIGWVVLMALLIVSTLAAALVGLLVNRGGA